MKGQNKVKKIFKPTNLIFILIAIFAISVISTSFFIVDETEQSVITRFGKYNKTVGPGLQFKLPYGIDKNYNIPVKVIQTEQFGFKTIKAGRENEYRNNISSESTMLTGDLNIIDIEWIIQYRIVDPMQWDRKSVV